MTHINDTDKAFFKVLAVILSSFTKDHLTVAGNMLEVFERRFHAGTCQESSLCRILNWALTTRKDYLITK